METDICPLQVEFETFDSLILSEKKKITFDWSMAMQHWESYKLFLIKENLCQTEVEVSHLCARLTVLRETWETKRKQHAVLLLSGKLAV